MQIKRKMKEKQEMLTTEHGLFRNEDGAIDLASIMVGIIVIGLIGGVIAATVFAVIPWTQDNAAKQQLDSVVAAQSAYMGLASSVPPGTPAGHAANSYADSTKLEEAGLLKKGSKHCTVATDNGKGYIAFTRSDAGKVWTATDKSTKPVIHTGTLPTDCAFLNVGTPTDLDGDGIPNATDGDINGDGIPNHSDADTDGDGIPNATDTDDDGDGTPDTQDSTPTGTYVDPTPTRTVMTYNCAATTTGTLSLKTGVTGTESWSDGFAPRTYTNAASAGSRTLNAGVTYTMTFEGTYKTMTMDGFASCLRSVDHWGSETGVTSVYRAFLNTPNLTDLPANIPTTITNMYGMMHGATALNDPDVGKWNTANVTNMTHTFVAAYAFNQPLSQWNTSNVTNMYGMFENTSAFNQPLENWDVSKVTNMQNMFYSAKAFNQPLGKWNTSSVTNMSYMFQQSPKFNSSLTGWDTSNVTTMAYMFEQSTVFNQSLNSWNVSKVISTDNMFFNNPVYNQHMNNWNTVSLQNMNMMFHGAVAFNGNVSTWNTSNVTNMQRAFAVARAFNQPLNDWDVSNVTNMNQMFHTANSFNQPLDKWATKTGKVTGMFQMFYDNKGFNQYIKNWNVASVTNSAEFRTLAVLTAENSPF